MAELRLSQVRKRVAGSSVTICALIFIISFCIRLVYFLFYQKSPFFDDYLVDALFHQEWALEILKGDIFSLGQGDVLYKPPFYPYFMALVHFISNRSIFVLRFVQIILGSFNCVLIYLIASKYFSRKSSVISSLIYSFYFVAVYFDAEVEIPCVAIFLTLLSFYLIKEKRKWPVFLLSACLFGFSILALPTNLLLIPLYLLILFKTEGLTKTVLYLAMVILVLFPCTLRNLIYGKHFVLVSANGGINFYIGNNKHYDQTVGVQPGAAWERFSSQPYAFKGITSHVGEDRYWYEKSFNYIRKNPVHYLCLLLKKSVLYFMSYEVMRNRDIYFAWRESIFRKIPFVSLLIIFPAGILGLLISLKEFKKRWDLYFLLLLLILPCIIFFVTARYRLPSISIWSIFAGYFFTTIGKYIKAKKWNYLAYSLAGLVLLGFVTQLNIFVVKNPESRPHYNLGCIYSGNKDYARAIEHFQRCFDMIDPSDIVNRITKAEVAMRIGTIYNVINKTDLSLFYLDKAIKLFPEYEEAYFKKGITWLNANEDEAAYENFLKAFELGYNKNDIFDFFLNALHRVSPSESSIEEIIESSGNSKLLVMFYNYQGSQQLKKSALDKAKDCFERAYKLAPNDSTTLVNLGFIALKNNDDKFGVEFYQLGKQAGGRDYDYYFNYGVKEAKSGHLKSGIEYLLQASRFRGTARVYYNLGLANFRLGRNAEAVPYLEKALEIDGKHVQARTLLEHIVK